MDVYDIYPHAHDAFTEGLVYLEGYLYESTGLEGASSLRRIEPATGRIVQSIPLENEVFAEGLAAVGGRLVQLSYKSGRAFVYRRDTFQLEREFTYEGEGWGLCFDGRSLIMSNGTSLLQFRDPETFEILNTIEVTDGGEPVDSLNELECVSGEVFANVFRSRRIARIDPLLGEVRAWIDTAGILFLDGVGDIRAVDVLNGIAYVPERDRFLITGKYWPRVFEVAFVPGNRGAERVDH